MKKNKWNLENIKIGLKKFYSEHKRYPTSTETDSVGYLPSSRQIQRRFGGLPALRKSLKLSGPEDFTKGEYSSLRAKTINTRSYKTEKVIYDYLVGKFGIEFVHREHFFTDDRRTRTDFFIHAKDGNFSIDVFFPKDKHSLIGCINSKMRTYDNNSMIQYPVIFLMMNPNITIEDIDKYVGNKKNKLNSNQHVMTLPQMKKFCENKKPLKISKL